MAYTHKAPVLEGLSYRGGGLGDYEAGHDCEKRACENQGVESGAKVGLFHGISY